MSWLIDTIYYIVPFIIVLGVLVFVHEFGHYLMAKISGVKVEAFSIGFGKQLWGFTDKSGTKWKISAIPLGGYCQFLGDADASSSTSEVKDLTEEEKRMAFPFQPPIKKLLISIAGPAANYIFAIAIFASVLFFIGKIEFPAVVGEVIPNSAAEKAGIMAKDKIVSINGHKIEYFGDIAKEVELNTNKEIYIEIERNGNIIEKSFPLQPLSVTALTGERSEKQTRPMLGVKSINTFDVKSIQLGFGEAIIDASKQVWDITIVTLRGVGQMITGKRGSEDVGGVLRIAEMSGDITKEQGVLSLFLFMAMLSVNLGLINLFPIPLLDGGHVVIYLLEMTFGKELNQKLKDGLFKVGFALLIALMVFATWNDIVHLVQRWFA